ncbi:TrbM/KikA/MpfK family conjugal transfer protein [Campylobacter lari]|uniref:TrbM/KikA/MpfK family conjugal transfer protein n=1 Tax=Campylobacter lari TaxID=201 RepID=UPI003727D532
MKIKLISIILAMFMFSNLKAIKLDYLSGDTRYACEAMLCLASPIKPPECSAAIARYFAIKFKKPWKTIQARKDFLNLCPVDNSDTEMLKYKNDILAHLDGECSLEELNKRVEKKLLWVERVCDDGSCEEIEHYGYRINPQLSQSCYLLQSSSYTDYQGFEYICSKNFIEDVSWKRGYELKEISEQEYNLLPDNLREKHCERVGFKWKWVFYKKIFINKKCWIKND